MPTARNYVNVLSSSLSYFPIGGGQKYSFQPDILHENVRMGLIATDNDFVHNKNYYHHQFVSGENDQTFHWPVAGVSDTFTNLWLYVLLPFHVQSTDVDRQVFLSIGANDGEQAVAHGLAAGLRIDYRINKPDGNDLELPGNLGGTCPLPGDLIEFVSNYYYAILPQGDNDWAKVTVQDQSGESVFQKSVHLYFIDGHAGNVIKGVITDSANTWRVYTDRMGVNLLALVAPTITENPDGSTEVTFEIGDPERDAVIRITRV